MQGRKIKPSRHSNGFFISCTVFSILVYLPINSLPILSSLNIHLPFYHVIGTPLSPPIIIYFYIPCVSPFSGIPCPLLSTLCTIYLILPFCTCYLAFVSAVVLSLVLCLCSYHPSECNNANHPVILCFNQEVTKGCRRVLWLTNSALVNEPIWGGGGC